MHLLSTVSIIPLVVTLTSALPAVPSHSESEPPLERRASDGARLTIYWGAEDDSTTLSDVCNDPSYGIVNLSFLNKFHGDGGWPALSVGSLDGPSQAQQDAGATSLQDGSSLVDSINTCQSNGKLVLLSLGGADADVTLSDDGDAQKIADQLWNLFGGGADNGDLRPFGDVKLDGFDLDNESGDSTGYSALASRLRSNFGSDTSKTYYLSAAPQCPFPDQSEPLDVCQQLDFVWVQFYNNGDCDVAQSGFNDAVQQWSSNIGNAKLFIGALASGADGDEGYVDSGTLTDAIQGVKNMNLPNYGGAMLWEAQLAVKNGNYQQAIASAI